MRLPIFQFGCARACSGDTCSSSASGVLRNGPPLAVRTMRLHFGVRSTAETLVDRVVFAVDGQQLATGFFGCGHHQFACGNENFFVRERYGFAKLDGFVGGFKADDANGRGNDDVRFGVGADRQHSFAAVMYGG